MDRTEDAAAPQVTGLLALAAAFSPPYDRVVAVVNDHVVRLSVMTEPFGWHLHPNMHSLGK